MRILALLIILLGFTGAAKAQPSYSCSGNLNPTERTICNNAGLSKYDRDMVRAYSVIINRLAGNRKTAFRNRQTKWRQNRDACGWAVGCIRANYVYRIMQFEKMTNRTPSRTNPVPERLVSTKVLPDGSIERTMPDGSRLVRLPDGNTDRYLPDGTRLPRTSFRSNVQPSTLPPLPDPLAGWGSALEGSLLEILINILTESEYSAYLLTEADKVDYELIDWRLRSIAFLTQS
ncbi:MAG: lysozyme inhibitor LprI family protein [Pseudomonadota bacterium]